MTVTRCEVSGKVSYPTSAAAKEAARNIAKRSHGVQPDQYRCRSCKGVHLTSSKQAKS